MSDGSGQLDLVFNQAGLTQLNTANTFTGGATVSGGTVQLGNAGALNATTPNAVAFAAGSGAVGDLQLNGNSVTVLSLSSDGSVRAILENANATAGTLTVNNSVACAYGGVLRDGPGGGALTLDAAGNSTLILSGSNTYTGGSSVNSGTLQVGAGGNTGTLGAASVVDNSVLVFDRSDGYTLSNSVSGSGSLYEIGNGTLTLAGTNTLLGSIFATGAPSGSGALSIAGSAATTAATSLFVGTGSGASGRYTQSGGLLAVSGTTFSAATGIGLTVASSTGSTGTLSITGGTINGGGPLMVWGGTGSITVSQTGTTPTLINSAWLTLGQLSGAVGTLTQNGGTIALTNVGPDFYDGYGSGASGTYIMHGGLLAARNFRNDSGSGTASQDGGIVALTGSLRPGMNATANGTYTLAGGSLSAAIAVSVGESGTGTLTIGGSNGGTMVLSPTAAFIVANGTGTGTFNLQPGGLLKTPSIAKGAGTAAFSFSGGTLQNTPSTNLTVAMPVNLIGRGTVDLDNGQSGAFGSLAPISGSGSLFVTGGGTLTLSGTNSYTGGTTVLGGATLIATSPEAIDALGVGTNLSVGNGLGAFGTVQSAAEAAAAPAGHPAQQGSPVPEPATWGLLAAAIGCLLLWPRRR